MNSFSLTGARRKWQRSLTALLVVGAAGGMFVWLLWLAENRPEVGYLPQPSAGEWIVYPFPPQSRAQWAIERRAVFSRSFSVSASPGSALLQVRADTGCELSINGAPIELANSGKANWKDSQEREIGAYLHPGSNELTVTVTNADGPPALWLTITAPGWSLTTGGEWTASLDGAVKRAAVPARDPLRIRPGNPVYSGERTVDELRRRWPTLAGFALFACVLAAGAYILRRSSTVHGPWLTGRAGVRVAVTGAVVLWCALLWNNLQSLLFPIGFDAEHHLIYVQYIMQHKALPLADQGWETHQPPLYYVMSAAAFGLLGLATDDTGAVVVLRILAALAVLVQVGLVAASLRIIFPGRPGRQAIGVVLAAFLPVHFYMAHYVSNDILAGLLATGSVYLCLSVLSQPRASHVRLVLLGACLGAAALTKVTALVVVPVVLGVLAGQLLARRQTEPLAWLRRLGVPLLVCLTVSGWHFVRVWRHFGTPLVGSYDPASGFRWWQTPGYSTASFYFRFGQSLIEPYFSGYHGLMDGIYSTVWGDGLWGGVGDLPSRTPWNYDLMTAGYALALLPTAAVVMGAALALVQLIRRPAAKWFLLGGLAFAMSAAQVYHYLRLPYACHIKAFYALPALVPFCAYGAWGFDFLMTRWKPIRLVAAVLLATWAMTSYASFWVLNSSSQTQAWVGSMLAAKQRYGAAMEYFKAAVQTDESNEVARTNLGQLLLALGRWGEAQDQFERGLKYHPESAAEQLGLATALAAQSQMAPAVRHIENALDDAPDFRDQGLLGRLLMQQERPALAADAFRHSLGNMLSDPLLHQGLGDALLMLGDIPGAVTQYRLAVNLQPRSAEPLNRLARVLATSNNSAWRDGVEAVRLAEQAVALSRFGDLRVLDTLAAAYAEAGRFREAEQVEERAIQLVEPGTDADFTKALEERRQLYHAGKPYREKPKLP
jgi:tetratricopeptide (TPR) repeat protein